MTLDRWVRWVAKPAVFALSLLPLALLVWGGAQDALGPNPIEAILRGTGDWTLRFLLVTLSVTPLRRIFGWHWLVRLRRMLGLFAFFYAVLHLTTWIWLDRQFDVNEMIAGILKRPFITVGMVSFLLLVPLAATSTNAAVRRLGGARWQRLHRLVYFIAFGGVVHFLWMVKSDLTQPLVHGMVLALLLGFRLWDTVRKRVPLARV